MNWDDEDTGPAVVQPRRNTFVAPAAPLVVRPRVEVLPPAPHEVTPALPVQHEVRLTTSHVDRARGFTIVSVPLALALGFVAFLVGVVAFGVPWLSLPALLALCRELDHGAGGARSSAQADTGDALRRQLDALLDEVTELILEGQNARFDPQYRQAFHRESWAGEFADMRARLEAECDDLRWQIRVISRA